ncbi:MAG: hypothetical protein HGB17_16110, partial [Syntrophobacteraceae bacterium]|nr:hypothetical protein [Syntrophobacteraceae bacterium]
MAGFALGLVHELLAGSGSVVNLIGEAGIGKSRLYSELCGREYMQRLTVLEGRAIAVGMNLSHYPIIGLLKTWAGISIFSLFPQVIIGRGVFSSFSEAVCR